MYFLRFTTNIVYYVIVCIQTKNYCKFTQCVAYALYKSIQSQAYPNPCVSMLYRSMSKCVINVYEIVGQTQCVNLQSIQSLVDDLQTFGIL